LTSIVSPGANERRDETSRLSSASPCHLGQLVTSILAEVKNHGPRPPVYPSPPPYDRSWWYRFILKPIYFAIRAIWLMFTS